MSQFAFLDPERDRGEWLEAWNRLRRFPELRAPAHVDETKPCPSCCADCGECWQYMGSSPYRDGEATTTGRRDWVHGFRHRCSRGAISPNANHLPAFNCGDRIYRNVMASPGWAPAVEVVS